ncbi:MAG: septal junction protein FraD [Nostocales cyanobacterium 94392]|nr:septal junction protein FraD [Nostocales cyanobacterium 94392]
MGVIRQTLDLLGLTFLFDIFKDVVERIKYIFIPPKAFSWQTLIYLSVFSWLMSYLADEGAIRSIIAFFGWVFLIAGTSWYTTDKPLYIPGTIMPVGAVITGGIVSIFAFRQDDAVVARTIIFWPTISALITAIPEFFEGSGTDVKTQLPKLEDRESLIVLIGCCMLLSCWLNVYVVTDTWMREYPSATVNIGGQKTVQRSDLLTFPESTDTIPRNGRLILEKLQQAVETALRGKSWSNVELWLKNANREVNQLGEAVITIHLAEFEEKELWETQATVDNLDPKNPNSGYILNLFSYWNGPSAVPDEYDGYYLQKSCQIEPITEPVETLSPQNEKITVAEIECLPEIRSGFGKPPQQKR